MTRQIFAAAASAASPDTYIYITVLIILSAFFSASETAYASANRLRLKKAAENGGLRARTAHYIADNFQNALSTILVGNNLVNIASSSLATVIALSLVGEQGTVYATALMTVIILIFGEIVPKNIAREHSESLTRAFALPLRFLMIITKPIVAVLQWMIRGIADLWGGSGSNEAGVTEDELSTIIEMVEDEGVIDSDRSELLQSAIDFSDITAQEIITPRVDMLAIDIDESFDEIAHIANTSPYSRIPVYKDSIDNIIGILYLNLFFKKAIDGREFDIHEMLIETCYVPKTLKLPYVLAELKKRKQHLAIVTDEYGGTLGMLTIEDVLEQLVGEIWDETDEITSEFRDKGDGTYEISGDLSIYEFLEYLDLNESCFTGEYTTVGGWVIDMLNGFPNVGDSFEFMGFKITVTEMDDLRVVTVKAEKLPAEEDNDK